MTGSSDVEILDTPACALGEGAVWRESEQALYWTDIEKSGLYRRDAATGDVTRWALPDRLGSFAFDAQGRILAAFAPGLARFSLDGGDLDADAIDWIWRLDNPTGRLRFNDGKAGPDGRFLAGTMDQVDRQPLGALWSFGPGGEPRALVENVRVSNSLAWSPDGRTLYFADTRARRIDRYAYDPDSGDIGPRETHNDVSDLPGGPDGSAIDAEGGLWTAFYGGSLVLRTLPDGTRDRVIETPARQPTCCAFGDEDLSTLYITTAAQNLDSPSAADGRLLRTRPGVAGLPAALARL